MAAAAEAKLVLTAQDKTDQAFRSIEASMKKMQAGGAALSVKLNAILTSAAVYGLISYADAAVTAADNINDLAEKTGITGERLSALAYVAKQSGTDIDGLAIGLKSLAKNMTEAAGDDKGDIAQVFKSIGVSATDASGKLRGSEDVLLDIADRFAGYEDGAAKAALAQKLFGKSGMELIPFLNNGSAGINQLTAKARELGIVLDEETIKRSAEFKDQVDGLNSKLQTVAAQVASGFLPAMTAMAQAFTTSSASAEDLRSFGEDAATVLALVADVATKAAQAVVAVGGSFRVVAADLNVFFTNSITNKAEYEKALAERNKILADANKAYDKLWNDAGDKYYQAVLRMRDANKALAGGQDVSGSDHRFKSLEKPVKKKQAPVPHKDKTDEINKAFKNAAEAQFTLLKDALDRQLKELDNALDDNLVSIRNYWFLRTQEMQAGLDREIDAKHAALAVAKPDEAKKIKAEITILQRNRAQAGIDGARAQEKAEKELQAAIRQTRDELLDLTGETTSADRRAALERQYQPLIDKMKANGQDTAVVSRLIDVKTAKADLDQLQSQYSTAMDRMRLAEERLQLEKDAGIIDEVDMREKLNELHSQTADEVDALIPKMRELAGVIGGPEGERQIANIERLTLEQQKLKQTTNELALAMENSFASSLSTLFQDVINKSSSAGTAFRSFCNSIAQAWQKAVADIMARQLTGSIFRMVGAYLTGGADTPTSDYGYASGSDVGEYAEGGLIAGPGTGTSDDIPAYLSNGEYVLRAAAVQRLGVGFLNALNHVDKGPRVKSGRLAFASGGLVDGRAAGGGNTSLGVFNYFDLDQLAQALSSNTKFEKVVVQHAIANGGSIQQGWQS